MAMGNEIT